MAVPRAPKQPGTGGRSLPSLPAIESLPLPVCEPGVRPLPVTTDRPRTLGLRRIHILNHGLSTYLKDWEVWVRVPWQDELTQGRLISRLEWASMRLLAARDGVPVLCAGDSLRAPAHRPVKRDIPFVLDGLLPDDISAEGISVYVLFTDRTQRVWHYG